MKKCFIFILSFIFSLSVFAGDENTIIEQGSASYYYAKTNDGNNYMNEFDPFNEMLHGGAMTRARTKCYFTQIDPNVRCPDYVIGHATMKTGTPHTKICTVAKKAATAPRGCQRKHCTPCVYDNP